ncbi:MAG: hypothetical protein IT370_18915 [Deltaproteobacteria bacterium]|nr:hypothetical protein [Deltaproteobacteria bacterium]
MTGPHQHHRPRTRAHGALAALFVLGLLGSGFALGGGCAAGRPHGATTGGAGEPQGRRGALQARVRELRAQIQDSSNQLGLPRSTGAGFPPVAPQDGSPEASPGTSPMPMPMPMARGSKCERVCDLAEAICQDADEICKIADELGDDDSRQACDDSQGSCRAATQRCRGCR